MTDANSIVNKLWNYCHVLRDDGLSYQDYLEQITPLLFLKMADEKTKAPWNQESIVPAAYAWPELLKRDGDELEAHYRHTLEELGKSEGMLGIIFRKARNHIQKPSSLKRLIHDLIDQEQWAFLDADVKGDAYEGLLEKNAQDTKSGAGQYFTPRPLIQAMVDCIQPKAGETITDPACGTGGFLLAAHAYIVDKQGKELDKDQKEHLKLHALHGFELVDDTARLCAMNLFLHGIGPADNHTPPPIKSDDSLRDTPSTHHDIVLANPPFGKKGSTTVIAGDGSVKKEREEYEREDFWVTTANKQLNFVQHIKSLLKINGRAAVVVPDNVLFEGGAGEKVRRKLMAECDLHTVLRLPTGIFYAQGVKANVLFFERKAAGADNATKELWFYDLRTNKHFTLKTSPLKRADLDEFVQLYKPGEPRSKRSETWSQDTPDGRWRKYSADEILKRDKANLDIFWLKDASLEDAENLPTPEVLAQEIADDLEAALGEIRAVIDDLQVP